MRETFKELLESHPDLRDVDVTSLIEEPKDPAHGDLSFPCFSLAKQLRSSPQKIAQRLASDLSSQAVYLTAIGPYLNARFSDDIIARAGLERISTREAVSGRILIEYSQPNTNKPLHIGHMRNMILGKALIATLERGGAHVIPVVLYNDRGIAICKSMLAYERFGNGETPQSTGEKPDHFVGRYYRMYAQRAEEDPTLEQAARQMLRDWEAGDPKVRALWNRMNAWAVEGFRETFAHFDLRYEQEYYESDVYEAGVRIVHEALEKGIVREENNTILYTRTDGKDYTLLREDGTALYITQDIALLKRRIGEYAPDELIYVVGKEQAYHFETLFQIAPAFGLATSEKLEHYAYGLVTLPEGKMSSRLGRIVMADDLLAETIKRARTEVLARDPDLNYEAIDERARRIAFGALAFFMIKQNPMDDLIYDENAAMRFEGESGPYVQYTYARIRSILRSVESTTPADWTRLEPSERDVLKQLSRYANVLDEAARRKEPSRIAHYLLLLSQSFNTFYHSCKVIGSEHESRRIELCEKTSTVIKDGLSIVGIGVLEEM
jgi:arginyl-tRNA synthetase